MTTAKVSEIEKTYLLTKRLDPDFWAEISFVSQETPTVSWSWYFGGLEVLTATALEPRSRQVVFPSSEAAQEAFGRKSVGAGTREGLWRLLESLNQVFVEVMIAQTREGLREPRAQLRTLLLREFGLTAPAEGELCLTLDTDIYRLIERWGTAALLPEAAEA